MYLLDTNIISFMNQKGENKENIQENIRQKIKNSNQLFISVISYQEVIHGIADARSRNGNDYRKSYFKDVLSTINNGIIVLDYTIDTADIFAEIKTKLNRKGFQVDDKDLMIAASAVEAEFTLVTNNTKDFKNISGLIVEDWTVF